MHLTLLPFLIRTLVLPVRHFPQVNTHFDDDVGVLTRHDDVHLGIATLTAAGLIVPVLPVLRAAAAHGLSPSAAEVARLAPRRAGRQSRTR